MFSLDQISSIHSKVKSGADFPNYVQELKAIGMSHYDAFVTDGHIDYTGFDGQSLISPPKYDELVIAAIPNKGNFQERLKLHQKGGTDYPTFCRDCADAGIEKWRVDINEMTCTYYDKAGNVMLEELIPS
jgi:uncharacterized protein YbcV (DUF1398 family)